MGDFWTSWSVFAADVVTLAVVIVIAAVVIAGLSGRRQPHQQLRVRNVGERLDDTERSLSAALVPGKQARKQRREAKRERKARGSQAPRPRLFVLDFDGDVRASGTASLREEVTALVSVATSADEVLLRLKNPGGTVNDQGFAASQLLRLRTRDVPLTVAVDTMAASGGYMMAAVANRIVAAPFAIVGSIGVVSVVPNVTRLLERAGVEVEQFTAGRFKRTVVPYRESSPEDREKVNEEIAGIHDLFKAWVAEHRPQVDLDVVATGEHWYGTRALQLGLVDELLTSDDYVLRARETRDVFEVAHRIRVPPGRRLMSSLTSVRQALGGPR